MAKKNHRELSRGEIGQLDDMLDKMEAAQNGRTTDHIGSIAAKYLGAVEVLKKPIHGNPDQVNALKGMLKRFKIEAEDAIAKATLDGSLTELAAEIERQRIQEGDPCNLVDEAILTAHLRQSSGGRIPSLADMESELEKHEDADLMPYGNDLRKIIKTLGLEIQKRGN